MRLAKLSVAISSDRSKNVQVWFSWLVISDCWYNYLGMWKTAIAGTDPYVELIKEDDLIKLKK